jgi:hypothetical protein
VWGGQACGSVGVGSGGGWAAVSPGLRNGGGVAAFCSRGCISCWSPYSGWSLCILEMQHGMQWPLETVLAVYTRSREKKLMQVARSTIISPLYY